MEIENSVFNGQYRLTGASGIYIVSFEEFSIVDGESLLAIDSGFLEYSESLDPNRTRRWRWTDAVFSHTRPEDSIDASIREVVLERTGDDEYRASFDATLSVDGKTFTVSTNSPLESVNGDRFYTRGQFEIDGTDDLFVLIDADGGDPDSALVSVTMDGSTEAQIRGWSEEFYIDCLTESWPFRPTIDCD